MTMSLDAALQYFTSTHVDETQIAAQSESEIKPVVLLSIPSTAGYTQKRELQNLIVPLAFLFRGQESLFCGRDDISLVKLFSKEVETPNVKVFKNGAKVATVTTDGELKDHISTLVEHIGWSPDCPDLTHLDNYLAPIDSDTLLSDVTAFTVATGQRDYVANAANVSSIIWHAFLQANRSINWVGFYFVRPLTNPKATDHDHILLLGPFMGKPACSRIRYQNGVCGASWRTKSVQRVANVHEYPGHIACDDASKSELVTPVLNKQGEVVALIDLDCPRKNGFSVDDERTIVQVARIISEACDWANVGMPYTQP
ncbi:uncharacterized protein PHALS_06078 [Plasmopara halstedii]|uniref:GAF domain-containing protein n=1 Tax=Plasmopara halstedii TaxID=4781 RepID=A0A0P1AB98_PLAHL|nr:uncharacterized protein PHALS_06078 [Plasmopara halstedii]CEG38037.1 hypothetical protein PHALS_06078 [Plasmopara halstedii]|eukprot:XP_024574406.1 hypothetical protein PHALS_06078 [Plasmopara halstedii]